MIFQEAEVKAKIHKYNAEAAGMLAAFPKDHIVEVSGEDAQGKERSTADMVAEIKASMAIWACNLLLLRHRRFEKLQSISRSQAPNWETILMKLHDIRLQPIILLIKPI